MVNSLHHNDDGHSLLFETILIYMAFQGLTISFSSGDWLPL